MSHNKESVGLLGINEQQQQQPSNETHQQQQANNDARRSSKGSGNQSIPFSQTVKEAVAIAAGKKESGSDDDDGKNIKSNMLCYLYWLLVVLILGLISFTIWLSIQLARRHNEMNDHRKRFDFEDIFNASFHPRTIETAWIKGSDSYLYRSNNEGSLYLNNVSNDKTEKILDSSVFDEYKTSNYSVSHDLRYILLKYEIVKSWKHSFTAKYVVYDRQAKPGVIRVHHLKAENEAEGSRASKLQFAQLAPTTHAIVFVYDNNLFIQKDIKSRPNRLTRSGNVKDHIYNGVTDWTYDTLLHRSESFWWSPDSKHLVYLSLNDSMVEKFYFVKGFSGAKKDIVSVPYPRAYPTGNIPKAEVRLVSLDQSDNEEKHKVFSVPIELKDKDHYLSQVAWKDVENVVVVWLNRAQNKSYTTLYNIKELLPHNVHYQISTSGWIDTLPEIIFTSDNNYLTILPMQQLDNTYWNHLAIVKLKSGKMRESEVKFLTKGYEDVMMISTYNRKNNDVYYISTNKDPKKRHLFKLNIESGKSRCVTCEESGQCQWSEVMLSQSCDFLIQSCLGPSIPYHVLRTVNNSYTKTIEDNKVLHAAVANKIMPEKKYVQVAVGDEKKAWVEIIQPQEEGSKKFPLLIQASGEPGTQTVTYKYDLGWETFMASSKEVVVARVDVGGSGGRGLSYKHRVYKHLTLNDVDDLQLVGLHLKEFDLVDPAKVAVWGWGHSALMALHALANHSDIFPCGFIGNVMADVHFYDAPTFERYLGFSRAEDNQIGYVRSNLINKVAMMKIKKLALIQTLNDDHVKHASTMTLLDSLSDLDILHTYRTFSDLDSYQIRQHRNFLHLATKFLSQECFTFFWKHDTKTWIVDKAAKKEKFRIKQFCV